MKRLSVPSEPDLSPASYLAAVLPRGEGARDAESPESVLRYTINARSAICLFLRTLRLERGDSVLVPALVCRSVIQAIQAAGAEPVFYDVGPGCEIEIPAVLRSLESRTKVVLVIHYFGFPQDLTELSRVCGSRGILLLEDCAHSWLSTFRGRVTGRQGEAAVYSIRKFLPVREGGSLWIGPSLAGRISFPPQKHQPLVRWLKVQKELWEKIPLLQDRTGRLYGQRLLSATVRAAGVGRVSDEKFASGDPVPGVNGEAADIAEWRLSPILRRIIRRANSGEIVRTRRENFLSIHEGVVGMPHVKPLFRDIPDGVCPWGYPLIPEQRSGFDQSLRRKGIGVFTFGDPIESPGGSENYPNARALREKVLLLPCHQEITDLQVERMLTALDDLSRRR